MVLRSFDQFSDKILNSLKETYLLESSPYESIFYLRNTIVCFSE